MALWRQPEPSAALLALKTACADVAHAQRLTIDLTIRNH